MEANGEPLLKSWPIQDIIFVSMMGPLMLAAFVEWFLFLAAFFYCLAKVYQKADHWSIKVLAVAMMVLFVSFRTKRIKQVLDDRTAPKTVVVMPVYKEEPEVLVKAIDSVVSSDYPTKCIHVFLSFDGDAIDELYLRIIHHLGIPIALESYPQSIDVTYKGARVTVSRFQHGGKRHCQKQTFRLIDKVYVDYLKHKDNLFMLFIDSDCILDRLCLQNFMFDMELKPGSKHNMLAMTGIITSTTGKNSLITILQDVEYVHGQLFERSVESGCGAVTCLPGALTMLRFSAFRKMAKYYFADNTDQCEDLFDYAKCHLGEDRLLTHLFMIGAREAYQIQMCTSAFCKTEAVQTFRSLLKQRRRWFLGYITNEVCMLTDIRLWRRYPLLCLMRFMQNTIRTTALLFFIQIISIMTTSSKIKDLPVGFIAISLGLNYLLMLYFGIKLRRFKAWLYPLVFVINPFFNWIYMVYGIFTAGQRTWGGPRADAAKADECSTSEDDNISRLVVGDEEQCLKRPVSREEAEKGRLRIHPEERLNRRLLSRRASHMRQSHSAAASDQRRDNSLDLFFTCDSETSSICLPQDVETLMNEEDLVKHQLARQMRMPMNVARSDKERDGRNQRYTRNTRASDLIIRQPSYEQQSGPQVVLAADEGVMPSNTSTPSSPDEEIYNTNGLQHSRRGRLCQGPKPARS
ncbi:hypothetical protein FE257_005106 [Aspergillus nanangensis]|uniref:chitin synthase n=1 Tax=Aspergillus nanangensis TaxID=2582783 RepID=A0AAD4CAS1_ASPNN|nr:hypothetical protein FE257_005106 [Aspergillus nanangensis]